MPPPTFGFPARLDRSQGFFHGLRLWVSRLRRYLLLLLLLEAFGYFLGKGLVNVAAGRRALQVASDDRIETNRCRWLAIFFRVRISNEPLNERSVPSTSAVISKVPAAEPVFPS